MVLRSLQPRIARHVVGVSFAGFGSLVMALYDVEDGISRCLWADSSPSDVKGKKPFVGLRSTDVSAISSSSQRLPRRHQPVPQLLETHSSYTPQQFRPRAPCLTFDQTYQAQPLALPYYATQGIERPPVSYTATGQPCYAAQHAVEPGSSEAHRGRFVDCSHPSPLPQPIPAQFRMDLHCAYHQEPGHETDRCTALRHAIQDLIDQGLVHLDPEPIMPAGIYETSGVTLKPQMPAPFRLFPEAASVQATIVEPPTFTCYGVQTPFVLVPYIEEVQAPHIDDSQTLDVQYILQGGRVLRQPPPAAVARPLEETSAPKEARAEDDEILRQLHSTQARISIWSLLASSSTHRDALTRALSQIRVDTTTTPEGLIHMMTAGRATCIIFFDDDLTPDATAIALGYAHSDFGPSTQTVRAYDSTRREVMGTLEIELLIGPATFVTVFQVIVVQSVGDMLIAAELVLEISHTDDDLFLTGFTFDEVQTVEIEDFCRDFVAMSFYQHGAQCARYYAEHVLSTRHGVGSTLAWTERVHHHS
ncbi:hypothetical protein CK203_022397 [Vitis vinifera]|uniref:Uncharacterized protein n=1 Tax=Vitis vinifera TaxID=29760 RepID=A0A438I9Q3_VITVI|nr:hypothetical protein CK203_022397 [Vitis vinifera]